MAAQESLTFTLVSRNLGNGYSTFLLDTMIKHGKNKRILQI